MAKLEQLERSALALWVHEVELWGCIYYEKLDLITVFAKKKIECIGTP